MPHAPEQQVAACTTLATLPLSEHHETAVLVDLGGLSESRIHTHRTGILLHISLHLQNLDSMSEVTNRNRNYLTECISKKDTGIVRRALRGFTIN